jgi:hypothetical protein
MPGVLALGLLLSAPSSAEEPLVGATPISSSAATKHRSPLLAAGLNWFLPGAGYLYNGEKPVYVSLPMIAGAAGLTYVEQFHQFEGGTLREQDPTAFNVMFASVLVLNTGAAIDAWREAKAINAGGTASLDLSPRVGFSEGTPTYGVSLDVRY